MCLTVKVNVKDKTKALEQNTEAQALAKVQTTAQTKAMAMAITRAELEPKGCRWSRLWSRSWSLSWSWSWSWPWPWPCMVVGAHETQSLSSRTPVFQRVPRRWLWKAIIFRDRSRVSKVLQECAKAAWSAVCFILICALSKSTGSEASTSLTASLHFTQ